MFSDILSVIDGICTIILVFWTSVPKVYFCVALYFLVVPLFETPTAGKCLALSTRALVAIGLQKTGVWALLKQTPLVGGEVLEPKKDVEDEKVIPPEYKPWVTKVEKDLTTVE